MGSSRWPLFLMSIPSNLVLTSCAKGVPLLWPSVVSRPSTLSCKEIGQVTATLGTSPSLWRPSSWHHPSRVWAFAPLANLGAPTRIFWGCPLALRFLLGGLSLGFAFGFPELEFPGGTWEFHPNSISSCSTLLLPPCVPGLRSTHGLGARNELQNKLVYSVLIFVAPVLMWYSPCEHLFAFQCYLIFRKFKVTNKSK
jgi:hypothetical protein